MGFVVECGLQLREPGKEVNWPGQLRAPTYALHVRLYVMLSGTVKYVTTQEIKHGNMAMGLALVSGRCI